MSIPRFFRTPFWADSRTCPDLGIGQARECSDDRWPSAREMHGRRPKACQVGLSLWKVIGAADCTKKARGSRLRQMTAIAVSRSRCVVQFDNRFGLREKKLIVFVQGCGFVITIACSIVIYINFSVWADRHRARSPPSPVVTPRLREAAPPWAPPPPFPTAVHLRPAFPTPRPPPTPPRQTMRDAIPK